MPNCVTAIYHDLTYETVPWQNVGQLSSKKRYLIVKIHQEIGGNQYYVSVSGHDLVYAKYSSEGLIVGQVDGTTPEWQAAAHQHFFGFDETQEIREELPLHLYEGAAGGSDMRLFTYPYDETDYDEKIDQAIALDVGTC